MKVRAVAFGVLLAIAAMLGGRLAAHEPGDLQYLPQLDRFALAEAFRRGGEVERAALEAELTPIAGANENAVVLGRDLDGDGDPDEIHFHLEVLEIQEEVYPGEYVSFWVFAPLGSAMGQVARLPSPTLRVEEGDHVAITLYNTHYLPHTIHLHGTNQPNAMDGVPHITQHGAARKVVHLSLHSGHARDLLVSLPRAGSCASADGPLRHAHHRA
jgi:FtsP/CotA-like multicopper oxidase with cupredoxin domain